MDLIPLRFQNYSELSRLLCIHHSSLWFIVYESFQAGLIEKRKIGFSGRPSVCHMFNPIHKLALKYKSRDHDIWHLKFCVSMGSETMISTSLMYTFLLCASVYGVSFKNWIWFLEQESPFFGHACMRNLFHCIELGATHGEERRHRQQGQNIFLYLQTCLRRRNPEQEEELGSV